MITLPFYRPISPNTRESNHFSLGMKLYHVTENKFKLNKGSRRDKQGKRGDDGAHLCDNFRSLVLARSQDGWTCDARVTLFLRNQRLLT
jgi:hypothetical protein